ncbi:hypothetical protein APHAL10511_004523 [Amanita phalloides]|nr:hypothetical protein APHAL10511_004523 [Amanita phalloides]
MPQPAPGPSHSRSPSFFSFKKSHPTTPSEPSSSPPLARQSSPEAITSQPSRPSHADFSHSRHPSTTAAPQLHSEIRSLVQLNVAHAYKIYYSGPLVRRIERLPDGQKPTKDEGWTDIWAQLGGTTLSIWDMKQVQEASKLGREVPPTYVNMTDAFLKVLGAVTEPESPTAPARRYTDILAVNTAGSNLIFFSCPSREALMAWVAALRLSSWEKSRLEEIYTAHLIRVTQQGKFLCFHFGLLITYVAARDIPSTLIRGRMEGWVQIRIAGQTDWKRLWMVVQARPDGDRPTSAGFDSPSSAPRKRRVSSLFSRDYSPSRTGFSKPVIAFYSSQKPRDKKKPLLTMQNVSQAFAVYPERPELINRSSLIKVEGHFANEELAKDMTNREGWVLVMPGLEGGQNQVGEMLKWVIALHDAFGLYGRPHAWTWDPRDRASMMFGYPVGPQKESLFLDREAAEALDPRDDRTPAIRSNLQKILFNKMQNAGMRAVSPERQPPPEQQLAVQQQVIQQQQVQVHANTNLGLSPQLPPLTFGDLSLQQRTPLAPVAEASGGNTPETQTLSVDIPLNTTLPSVGTMPPPSVRSVATGHAHHRQPPVTSQAPSSDNVSSSQPPLVTSTKRNTQDSISGLSLSSPRSQPLAPSTSQSTSDDHPLTPTSFLTSPYSPEKADSTSAISKILIPDTAPPLTSHYSPGSRRREIPPQGPPPDRSLPSAPLNDDHALFSEAGALYYVNNIDGSPPKEQPAGRIPTTISERDNGSSDSDLRTSADLSLPATSSPLGQTAAKNNISKPLPTALERPRPAARSGLGRKPSGARELGTSRPNNTGSLSSSPKPLAKEDPDSDDSMDVSQQAYNVKNVPHLPAEDSNLDVLAALSYLDVSSEQPPPEQPPSQPVGQKVEPLNIRNQERSLPSSPLPDLSSATLPPPSSSEVMQGTQYKSSFALSKQAVERKAKVQAQQIAHHAAVHKPGRLNGKRKSKMGGAWGESSEEEEEEEEEEEDDEADSDDDGPASSKPSGNASSNTSIKPPQNQNASVQPADAAEYGGNPGSRTLRTLPQVPGGRPHGDEHPPQSRRMVPEQLPDANRRPLADDVPHIRSQSEFPHPGAAQKTLWSQVLEPGRAPGQFPDQHQPRDTFIQLEHPSETMTKAFSPQGLLSAGLQDKQDRSAKRQEELAREMGASLVNVPNKPPPPQTGLLGAITAHERERKREGGMGAALTEREREKRIAEERQRRFDEQQRQQLEQMQQGGSMYGQYPGFNPMVNPMMMGMMGMNPMMTGMNPMMTGGMAPMMTGYPSMMPGINPQQMFAQQAAAQAYQQAMMTYSNVGSHPVGGENGSGAQPMVPNMTGMGYMGGYDPRMSMMSMGMMAPQMSMPLGMQMTGMSTFDTRFPSMTGVNGGGHMNDMGLQPPNVFGAQNPASRSSSPARHSPATRPPELQLDLKSSRPTSPKP